MNKKKIETFGLFCELIERDRDSVYFIEKNEYVHFSRTADLNYLKSLKEYWNNKNTAYYHIPPKKKKTMAEFYCWRSAKVFPDILVREKNWIDNGEYYLVVPKNNTEFEVDDD